jgi:hypothetical protein
VKDAMIPVLKKVWAMKNQEIDDVESSLIEALQNGQTARAKALKVWIDAAKRERDELEQMILTMLAK